MWNLLTSFCFSCINIRGVQVCKNCKCNLTEENTLFTSMFGDRKREIIYIYTYTHQQNSSLVWYRKRNSFWGKESFHIWNASVPGSFIVLSCYSTISGIWECIWRLFNQDYCPALSITLWTSAPIKHTTAAVAVYFLVTWLLQFFTLRYFLVLRD